MKEEMKGEMRCKGEEIKETRRKTKEIKGWRG